MIFDEGGDYLKNEGEDKGITPHIENLIFDNNDYARYQIYKICRIEMKC